ncbi:ABC transporter substrate-binding protein [Kitasatospora sp. NPDC057223]|uniref:ABC transporter substrate-binding protein n=1 Tax=Kitasatospora sp. NPDC057223 TaxID=3346055 RepID=UPI003642970E
MTEARGELIGGRYRLVEPVGQGGMGRVWRGRDETLHRDVAVKEILFPPGLNDGQRELLLQRVMREARSAAGLNHPGIITVHDVAEHHGAPVIVMEFVVGASLAATIREQGRLPVERVARIGTAILEALTVAHSAGVVHRDLKPDNILLSGSRVVLTDFGIASMADATMALTSTGTILGTPAYMAPEQLEGNRADAASDLWALGATLYTAVEGEAPFTASTLTALYVAILTRDPRPPRHAGRLEQALTGLLTKDPLLRATAEQTARALAAVLPAPVETAPVEPARAEAGPGRPAPADRAPAAPAPTARKAPATLPPVPPAERLPTVTDLPVPPLIPPAPLPDRAAPGPTTPLDALAFDTLSAGRPAGPARRPSRGRTILLASLGLVAAGVVPTVIALSHLPDGNGGGGQTPPGGASPTTAGPTAGFDAAVGKVANPSAEKGGTLKLWSGFDLDSLDPARAYYSSTWNFERFYARTLLAYDAKPGKEGLQLVPDLATAQPAVSADGRTYTFRLRPGLKFEDGSAITSKDVKYGVERVFAQDVLPGGPTSLINELDQGQNYKGPYTDTDPGRLGLKSVTTPDDSTVVFSLAKPNADFPYLLAMGSASPVPQKLDTGAKYADKPVSSGPYRFSSAQPGKAYELVRNENWDQSTDPFRKALPDVVKLTISTAADDVDARLLDGSADLDLGQTGLSPAARAKVLADPGLKKNTDNPYTGALRYVSVAQRVAPFDNVHCRRAVLYAADTTALQTTRGGSTAGSLSGSMLPPDILGSDDYDPFGLTDGKPDLVKAREELAACGKPNGFSTTIAVRSSRPKDIDSATALQAALKAVGVDAAIDQYEAQLLSSVVGAPNVVHSKGYGLVVMGWIPDYPTGSAFLQPLTDGRLITATGNTNYSEINDPEINGLFDRATAEPDPAKAGELYKQINHKVVDGAYFLPLVAEKALAYRNPRLTNVFVNDAFGQTDFQALGLSGGG